MRDAMVDESDWISAHAFYQEDLGRLVVDVVDPLAAELTGNGLADGWFFLRYWDGGPHLRLRVLPARAEQRATVEELIRTRFAEYFSQTPSADTVRPEEYARVAPMLAGWEGVRNHLEELRPNNSVSFIPYLREHDRYGRDGAVAAVERHFCESSEIAARVLRDPLTPTQRATTAAALVALAWFCREPEPARLVTRLDAGGQVPVAGSAPQTVPPDGAGLVDLVRRMRMLAARVDTVDSDGTLAAWARSVAKLRDALVDQVACGALALPRTGWQGAGGVTRDDQDAVLVVLDVCAHLVCNRLGVSTVAEGAIRRRLTGAIRILGAEGN